MGRIRVLSDQVANQIAAGEVVERPASVVKELLENALDAGATRIRVEVEAGGRKLIRITDNGHGMGRDDALLAFERHATSKIRSSDDLLSIATLGFRGEALPSIASVARLVLATREKDEDSGTEIEIAGGKVLRVDDAGLPPGTTITIRDLFFNTPARRKFLKSEQTELTHVAALVTHYALAHPRKHFELHSATQALLVAPGVANAGERIFQIFGRDVFQQMLPVTAEADFARSGIPDPPPWKRDADWTPPDPGFLRLTGFVSKPELQKLNRNSIYIFVNDRLIRDRVILHALSEAYRNILPPTSYPVVLLFLEMPPQEVDVNVHPAKTEVRFRQSSFIHDFLRDAVRNTLMKARPAADFMAALQGGANTVSALTLDVTPMPNADAASPQHDLDALPQSEPQPSADDSEPFILRQREQPPIPGRLEFTGNSIPIAASFSPQMPAQTFGGPAQSMPLAGEPAPASHLGSFDPGAVVDQPSLRSIASLRPLGQLRESFILAVNDEGLWIIDQHVAHERILFEKILRERQAEGVQRQRLLMPLLVELLPAQMVAFSEIAEELERNGFEAEPFGPRTLTIKAVPLGLEGHELEQMLEEVLSVPDRDQQVENNEKRRARIAASIACHAAIKINMPLEASKMVWLLEELAKTEHPTGCPHGRPIVLRYSLRDIERAFHRI
ncbi:MAG TPA: DNA mismatch repair endonuclease MutL [Acidobacteriaceae bacterium]